MAHLLHLCAQCCHDLNASHVLLKGVQLYMPKCVLNIGTIHKMHLAAKLCRWKESNFCPTCLDLFILFIHLYLALFYYSFLSSPPIEERKAI